jgi:TRAP-type C4-dicarboxylate transport system substrate-binding protein
MFVRRVSVMLLVAAVTFALAACQSSSSQEPAASAAETIPAVTQQVPTAEPAVEEGSLTLRLAIPDTRGRASEPFILEFIDQVDALSNGQITIEPVWDAGANTEQREEHGVLVAVLDGDYDLGLAASRIFEHEGITTFQPLQTPFLIDNDALAVAVAESDMATQMLDALPASGLVGLTLWPEDLRHIFSIVPGEPVLSPADLAGQTVRTTSEGVTSALVDALGGTPELYASNYDRIEAGLLQGYSLSGRPIATGNVTFFSKFQVLFGNGDAFDRLTAEQQAVLREAAAAVQAKALAEHPGDAAAGAAWCADGGTIVLAGDEQLAAFKDAAQPVAAIIEADPANAAIVATLSALKDSTEPSPGAEACGEVGAAVASSGDEESWSPGLPPNGVWQVDLTEEDVIRMGVLEKNAPGWAGPQSYEFNDGEGIFRGEFHDGVVIVCPYTYEVVDDFFRLTYVDKGLDNYECGDQVDDLQWRLDDDGLHLHLVDIHDGLLVEMTAAYEARPWQLVANP